MNLWVERNMIFDAKGYCFGTPLAQDFFDNSDCTTKSPHLSEREKGLVRRLKSRENALGCDTAKRTWTADALKAAVSPTIPTETALSPQDARTLQKKLTELGYYSGEIDGDFGPASLRALDEWRKDRGSSTEVQSARDALMHLTSNGLERTTEKVLEPVTDLLSISPSNFGDGVLGKEYHRRAHHRRSGELIFQTDSFKLFTKVSRQAESRWCNLAEQGPQNSRSSGAAVLLELSKEFDININIKKPLETPRFVDFLLKEVMPAAYAACPNGDMYQFEIFVEDKYKPGFRSKSRFVDTVEEFYEFASGGDSEKNLGTIYVQVFGEAGNVTVRGRRLSEGNCCINPTDPASLLKP
jgi:hypothetical protein